MAGPGTPDPTEHNKLLAAYAQAIEELAKERGARFVIIPRCRDDHELTALALVELGKLTFDQVQYQAASTAFLEATYVAAVFEQYDVLVVPGGLSCETALAAQERRR